MSRYFVRRILETIPLMLIISIFVFMFIHLIPGDPARSIAGLDAEEWEVEAIREEYGLNKPIVTQYVDYMVKLFHGDMGRSMKSDTPVTELIADRMPQTLKLVFAGVIWAPALGIFIGVISAIKHGKLLDHICMLLAITGLSAPGFWLGLMGIQIFSVQLGWLPSGGLDTWKGFILPSFTMGCGIMAVLARYSRSSMLETLREDYVRTARAKGQKESMVMFAHAFRNSLIHHPGPADRRSAFRFGSDRDRFLHPRHGQTADRLHPVPRLRGYPGPADALRAAVCPDQPDCRPALRRHQPEDQA